jgi:hypothetical protein
LKLVDLNLFGAIVRDIGCVVGEPLDLIDVYAVFGGVVKEKEDGKR